MEESLIKEISAFKRKDPLLPLKIVVPSNLTGIYLRRMLAAGGAGHVNVNFCTLPDLMRELAEYAGSEKKPPLPFYGEERIVRIIAEKIPGDSYFAPVGQYAGFPASLKQTFQELREAKAENYLDDIAGKKGEDLRRLFSEYRCLIGNFSHPFINFKDYADTVSGNSIQSAVFVYGVYQLNNMQKEILSALAAFLPMVIFVPGYLSTHHPGRSLLGWFKETGFKTEEYSVPVPVNNIARLQNNLLRPSGNLSGAVSNHDDPDDFPEIWSAPGEVREVQEIGRKIISLAGEGYLFHEMAVLVKDPAYYALLEETFESLGVPYYLPAGVTLNSTRTGRALLMCLQMAKGTWPRSEVMDLLGYAPFNYKRVLETDEEPIIANWNYISLKAGITSLVKDKWEEKLEQFKIKVEQKRQKDEEYDDNLSKLEKTVHGHTKYMRGFLEKLFTRLRGIPDKGTWSKIVGEVEQLLTVFFEDGKEKQAILKILTPLRGLDAIEDAVDYQAVCDLISDVLGETSFPKGSFQGEGVTVCPPAPAQNIRFKVVFIPGMLENKYPSPIRQDPLIPDQERKKLGRDFTLRRESLQYEALSFMASVNAAGEKLFLSYPRFDSRNGKEQLFSHYLLKVGEALTGKKEHKVISEDFPGFRYISSSYVPAAEQAVSENEFEFAVCRAKYPAKLLHKYFAEKYPWFSAVHNRWLKKNDTVFTEHDGVMKDTEVKKILARRHSPGGKTVSISYLSDYITCPYYFFLKRLLELAPPEEPGEFLRMEAPEKGILIHRILELFYREAKTLLPLDTGNLNEALLLMDKVTEKCFREAEEKGITGHHLYWKEDRHNIREEMHKLIEHEAEHLYHGIPAYFEVPFGSPSLKKDKRGIDCGAPVTVITGENHESRINFRGRIDRVDLLPGDKLQVIDYKTGQVRVKEKNLESGVSLQLAVYILAAGELFNLSNMEDITAAFYYVSQSAGFKKVFFSGSNLQEKYPLFTCLISVISKGISRGYYFPYPFEQGRDCSWCAYRSVCGTDITHIFNRKSADPGIKGFLEAKEFLV